MALLSISGARHLIQAPSPVDEMERLAGDLHMLSFDMRGPSRSIARADRFIAEAERTASLPAAQNAPAEVSPLASVGGNFSFRQVGE